MPTHFAIPCLCAVLALSFLVRPAAVRAEGYDAYVDADPSAEEDGSKERPFSRIEKAVAHVLSKPAGRRRILVRPGTYRESFTLGPSVRLFGSDKGRVVVEGGVAMRDGSALKKLSIVGGVVAEGNADVVLEDCEIKDFGPIGVRALPGKGRLTVRQCRIRAGGKGIYVQEGRTVELSDNEISGNREEGLDIRADVSGSVSGNAIRRNGESGIEVVLGGSDLVLRGNTIEKNKASGIAGQFYRGSKEKGRVHVRNNRIADNGKEGFSCGTPSGGDPSRQYWNDSVALSDNILKDNALGPIDRSCKIDTTAGAEGQDAASGNDRRREAGGPGGRQDDTAAQASSETAGQDRGRPEPGRNEEEDVRTISNQDAPVETRTEPAEHGRASGDPREAPETQPEGNPWKHPLAFLLSLVRRIAPDAFGWLPPTYPPESDEASVR
jgi:parallel beta-helix repeat protein